MRTDRSGEARNVAEVEVESARYVTGEMPGVN